MRSFDQSGLCADLRIFNVFRTFENLRGASTSRVSGLCGGAVSFHAKSTRQYCLLKIENSVFRSSKRVVSPLFVVSGPVVGALISRISNVTADE